MPTSADPAGAGAGAGIGAAPIAGAGPIAGMPGMPTAGAEPGGKPKSLKEQALDEFIRGNDDKGFELLHTYYAMIPSAGEELAEKMAWNPGLRRPALGPRFAFGAIYNAPSDFEDSPQPVGSDEAEEALEAAQEGSGEGSGGRKSRRGKRGGGANADPGAAMPAMPAMDAMAGMPGMGGGAVQKDVASEQLDFYTGEFGTAMLDALKARFSSGDYGLVLQDLVVAAEGPGKKKPNQANVGMAGIAGVPGMAAMPMPGIGGADANPAGENAEAEEGDAQPLGPAIAWVGTAKNRDELIKRATRADADVLILYEVSIRPATATKFVNNSTKLRIGAIKRGSDKEELIFNSALLNNRTVIEHRKKGQGEDPVEREINKAIAALDAKYTTTPLPDAITAERAVARIEALVAANPDDPLPVMVEARFYAEKGLLRQDELMKYGSQLLGEERYAEMLGEMPGAGAGQLVGSAVSLSGLIGLMRGVNDATEAAGDAASGKAPAGGKAGGGLGGLLPFNLGGQPAAEAAAGP